MGKVFSDKGLGDQWLKAQGLSFKGLEIRGLWGLGVQWIILEELWVDRFSVRRLREYGLGDLWVTRLTPYTFRGHKITVMFQGINSYGV